MEGDHRLPHAFRRFTVGYIVNYLVHPPQYIPASLTILKKSEAEATVLKSTGAKLNLGSMNDGEV
jgi:hypothetical protein